MARHLRERPDVATADLEPHLMAARDRGVANLAAIAAAEAPAHGLTVPQCLSYLRDNLHYKIGPAERDAIGRFHDLTHSLGLLAPAASAGIAAATRPPQTFRLVKEE